MRINSPHIEIATDVVADMAVVRSLWTEYWASLGLPPDFQNFDAELQDLPGKYSPPGGSLAIATINRSAAGTVALRPLSPTTCEVKRLYVRTEFRGCGVGRALMLSIIQQARDIGYLTMYGDTLPTMSNALRMYQELGFQRIDKPYSDQPTPGAIYLELRLG